MSDHNPGYACANPMRTVTGMYPSPGRNEASEFGEVHTVDARLGAENALAIALQKLEAAIIAGQVASERWAARPSDAEWLAFKHAMDRFTGVMRAQYETADQVLARVKTIVDAAVPNVVVDSLLWRTIVSQSVRSYFSS